MIEGFVQGIINLGRIDILFYLLIGVIIAVIFGVFPVIGGEVGIVLLLPFVFGMDPVIVLPLLLAVEGVTYTAACIPSILLNIPGSTGSVATCIDGFPMAQKGESGRAIGAAVTASTLGGILTVPFALVMIPFVVPFVLKFRSPEMFFTILVGLCFLGVLGSGNMIKGLISGGLGLLLSFIGFQSVTGEARFTFGSVFLYDGLSLIDVALALFAVPAIVELSLKRKTISPGQTISSENLQGLYRGVRDVLNHWGLFLRSSIIGYIVGIIPGIGASAATFIAYGQAKQTSKDPEKFGKGCVEGIIAPESANNAKEAGALLTTLALGIPGSGAMAIMLAAFLLVGIKPGPLMLIENTSICFTLLLSIVVANIFAGLICFFGAPKILFITRISPVYLCGILLPIVYIGSFLRFEAIMDIIIVVILSVMGICIRKFDYSPPSVLLGFILGNLLEYHFWHSIQLYSYFFFLTPISMILILLVIVVLCQNALKSLFQRWFGAGVKGSS